MLVSHSQSSTTVTHKHSRVDQAVLLTVIIQRRHHATGEHVVDQLQKAFVSDVRVREQEHDFLVVCSQHAWMTEAVLKVCC